VSVRPSDILTTPRADDLGLVRIANASGLSVSILPNGCIFAFEHVRTAAEF